MKKIVLVTLIVFSSCTQKETELKSFITEKIWIDNIGKGQQFYFANDGYRYLWLPSGVNKSYEYSKAIGNPSTHPFPLNNQYKGWKKTGKYKIIKDSLFIQNINDLQGKNIYKRKVELDKDSVVGITEYNSLKIMYYNRVIKWLSEKK